MRHVAEYRDSAAVSQLVRRIRACSSRPWRIMEVCGGQTHGLVRNGLIDVLSGAVEFLHGPGCPVCVTPASIIDQACALAREPNTVVGTFGDMLRVPGTSESLWQARSRGAQVRMLYSPMDAVAWARRAPSHRHVVLAVGFETTAPATALAILQAAEMGLTNFQVLPFHVRVLPAMELLLADPQSPIQAFLAAGHVCTVTGTAHYDGLVARHRLPVVVTGFEPVDLLGGILECVEQLESGRWELQNRYARVVQPGGNSAAQAWLEQVFTPADGDWRGIGSVPGGCLAVRPRFRNFCVPIWSPVRRNEPGGDTAACPVGAVLLGQLRPVDCPEFGRRCTPATPLGPPMISSEGACAAWFASRRSQGGESAGGERAE